MGPPTLMMGMSVGRVAPPPTDQCVFQVICPRSADFEEGGAGQTVMT